MPYFLLDTGPVAARIVNAYGNPAMKFPKPPYTSISARRLPLGPTYGRSNHRADIMWAQRVGPPFRGLRPSHPMRQNGASMLHSGNVEKSRQRRSRLAGQTFLNIPLGPFVEQWSGPSGPNMQLDHTPKGEHRRP